MPRYLDSNMISGLLSSKIRPVFLVTLQFDNETVYVWNGVGNFVWNATTYLGIGNFGSFSPMQEGSDVQAQGITFTLSGIPLDYPGVTIDPLDDSLQHITFGKYAEFFIGALDDSGNLIGTPFLAFFGLMDQATIDVGANTMTVTIAVESRLADMNRAPGGRYTDQDQRSRYPNDGSLKWVAYLQDAQFIVK